MSIHWSLFVLLLVLPSVLTGLTKDLPKDPSAASSSDGDDIDDLLMELEDEPKQILEIRLKEELVKMVENVEKQVSHKIKKFQNSVLKRMSAIEKKVSAFSGKMKKFEKRINVKKDKPVEKVKPRKSEKKKSSGAFKASAASADKMNYIVAMFFKCPPAKQHLDGVLFYYRSGKPCEDRLKFVKNSVVHGHCVHVYKHGCPNAYFKQIRPGAKYPKAWDIFVYHDKIIRYGLVSYASGRHVYNEHTRKHSSRKLSVEQMSGLTGGNIFKESKRKKEMQDEFEIEL